MGLSLASQMALMLGRQNAGGASPLNILGSSLIAWWSADRADLITLSGNAVTSWKDVVAGYEGAQGLSAARPIYSATSFGGAPSLFFDGNDDRLECTDAALLAALPDGANPCEIWAIAQQDALAADTSTRYLASYGGALTATRRLTRGVSGGVNRGQMVVGTGAGSTTVSNANVDLSGRLYMTGRVGATETQVDVGSNAGTPAAVVPATALDPVRFRIGSNDASTPAGFWSGQVRHVLLILPNITADQRTAMRAWSATQVP